MTELTKPKTFKLYFLVVLPLVIFAHLSFVSAQTPKIDKNPSISASQMAEIIDSIIPSIDSVYIFPDVAKKMIKLVRKNLRKGKYKDIKTLTQFTHRLTEDLQSISKDKHLSLHPGSRQLGIMMDDNKNDDERRKEFIAEQATRNFGFAKLERLDGNIGYLDLRAFSEASYAGATAIAAMNFLANSSALIIDLRKNGGGSPSMIQLISSYFFDERKHLNSFYIRKTDEIEQYWTQSQVVGPRMSDMPIYILTSSRTFSAAERTRSRGVTLISVED
ncbi:MAG: S41 family peptidase [candidate division Zixibacteria bacterium]|nr:S41 family peptidase [candidate division Zixibacteria bacterium]